MRAAATSVPGSSLAYPERFAAGLGDLALPDVLTRRAGLPRLAAAIATPRDADAQPLRVCYMGGSVTEQRSGYRPRVTSWIQVCFLLITEPSYLSN